MVGGDNAFGSSVVYGCGVYPFFLLTAPSLSHPPTLPQEHECQKIFRDFYRGASSWLASAQGLLRTLDDEVNDEPGDLAMSPSPTTPQQRTRPHYDTIVSGAFFEKDGGASCGGIVDAIVAGCREVVVADSAAAGASPTSGSGSASRRVVVPFEDAALAASLSESMGGSVGGPSVGVGSQQRHAGGPVVWVAAEIPGTNLHVTIVPPPPNRQAAGEGEERKEALKRLKGRSGARVMLSVSKYHLAEESSGAGGKASPPARKKREWGRNGRFGGDGLKRLGFWEVDAIESAEEGWVLDDAHQLKSQRRCYHITDVGSLGKGTAPKMAFQVMSECVRPNDGAAGAGAAAAGAAAVPSTGTPSILDAPVPPSEQEKRLARLKRFGPPAIGAATIDAASASMPPPPPVASLSSPPPPSSSSSSSSASMMEVDGAPPSVIHGENWSVRTFPTGPMKIEATISLH